MDHLGITIHEDGAQVVDITTAGASAEERAFVDDLAALAIKGYIEIRADESGEVRIEAKEPPT